MNVPTAIAVAVTLPMAANGQVEGPPRSAHQAPRAHNIFQRPRPVTTYRSRSTRTIVRRRTDLHEYRPLVVRQTDHSLSATCPEGRGWLSTPVTKPPQALCKVMASQALRRNDRGAPSEKNRRYHLNLSQPRQKNRSTQARSSTAAPLLKLPQYRAIDVRQLSVAPQT